MSGRGKKKGESPDASGAAQILSRGWRIPFIDSSTVKKNESAVDAGEENALWPANKKRADYLTHGFGSVSSTGIQIFGINRGWRAHGPRLDFSTESSSLLSRR